MNSDINYRLIGSAVDERYHTPHTSYTDAILDKKFEELTNGDYMKILILFFLKHPSSRYCIQHLEN